MGVIGLTWQNLKGDSKRKKKVRRTTKDSWKRVEPKNRVFVLGRWFSERASGHDAKKKSQTGPAIHDSTINTFLIKSISSDRSERGEGTGGKGKTKGKKRLNTTKNPTDNHGWGNSF